MNIINTKQGYFRLGNVDRYIEKNFNYLNTFVPLIFFTFLIIISLSVRRFGNYGVETDFFWTYIPEAKSFLAGNIAIDGFRGPVYPMVLGIFSLLFRDFFVSGIIISVLSASIVLFFTARIITILSNSVVGILVVIFLAINPAFIQYSYNCGTDMFFNALCSATIFYYLKRNKYTIPFIIINGILAGILYLTRSNGLFILVIGIFILYDLRIESFKKRLSSFLIFITAFIIVLMPWSFYCYSVTGTFFYDKNFLNIAFEIYNRESISREQFWFGNNHFNSFFDVLTYKPLTFVNSFLINTYENFSQNLQQLVGLQIGMFFLLGILLKLRAGIAGTEAKYFIINLCFFILLSFVFYDERFSLFLIPFYLYLALNVFYGGGKSLVKYWPKDLVGIIVSTLLVWTLITSISYNMININFGPKYILEAKDKFEHYGDKDLTHKILASRKPYLAYQLDLEFQVIPYKDSLRDIINNLRKKRVSYLYWGSDEKNSRPDINIPQNPDSLRNLGLEKMFSLNDSSEFYKIIYDSPTKNKF